MNLKDGVQFLIQRRKEFSRNLIDASRLVNALLVKFENLRFSDLRKESYHLNFIVFEID